MSFIVSDQKEQGMKAKIKNLAIEIAVILGLLAATIAFGTNGLRAGIPTLF